MPFNMQPQSTTQDFIVIEAGRTEKNCWADLWRYRELFLILAWRDVSVRDKQTIIGVAWAVVRAFLTMVVFTVIFGRIAALPSDGAPYALMVFAAMLPWVPVFNSAGRNLQQLDWKRETDQQGLLPPADHPGRDRRDRLCGVSHQLHDPFGAHGLLPLPSRPAHPVAAGVHSHGATCEPWSRFMDYRAQCEVPRFPLRDSLPRSVWTLRFSRGFQQQRDSREMAAALQPESNCRRHRWFPLEHSRKYKFRLLAQLCFQYSGRKRLPVHRYP